MQKNLICGLIFLIISQTTRAENILNDDYQSLAAHLGVKHSQLNVELQNKEAKPLVYQPNVGAGAYVSAAYKRYSASLGLDSINSDYATQTHGETQARDYQLRFHGDRWSPEFYYQSYQGYFLENTTDFSIVQTAAGGRLLRPDLKASHWGAQLFYNFSPQDYSLASHFSLRSQQLESRGSWFSVISYNQYSLQGEQPLVPTSVDNYGAVAAVTGLSTQTVSVGFAGAYNFIFGHYFVGALLGLGLNYQNTRLQFIGGSQADGQAVSSKTYVKIGLGYNGQNFLAGASLNVDGQNVNIEKSNLVFDTIESKFFIGWKFHETDLGWLDRIDRQIAEYLP